MNLTTNLVCCVLVVLCVNIRSRDCIQLEDMERATDGAFVEAEEAMTSHADDDVDINVTSDTSVGGTSTPSPMNSSVTSSRLNVDTTPVVVVVVGDVDGSVASDVDGRRSSAEERRDYDDENVTGPPSTTSRSPAVEPGEVLTTSDVSLHDVVSSVEVELLSDRQSSGPTTAARLPSDTENPEATGSQTDDDEREQGRLQASQADPTTELTSVTTELTSVNVFSVVVMTTAATTTTKSIAGDEQTTDDGGLPVTSDGDVISLTPETAQSTSDEMTTTTITEVTREADDVMTTKSHVYVMTSLLASTTARSSTSRDVTSSTSNAAILTTLQRLTGNVSTIGTTDRKLLSSTVWTSSMTLPVEVVVPGSPTAQSEAAGDNSTSSSGLETSSAEAVDSQPWPLGLPLAAAAGALAAGAVIVVVIIIVVVVVAVRLSRRSRNRHSFVSDRSFNYRRNADIVIEPRQPRTSWRSKRPSDVLELDGIALSYKRGLAPPSARIDGDDNVFHGTFPSTGAAWKDSSVENIDSGHANGNKTNNLYGKDSDSDTVPEKGMSTFSARNAAYRGRHPPANQS